MDELIYRFLLASAPIVQSGIPLMIFLLASAVLFFTSAQIESERKAMVHLKLTAVFCALVWLFYYAEIWSPERIPVFDIGAPLLALLALVVLPVLAILVWVERRVFTTSRWRTGIFILANCLIAFSLTPGIFLVWFYAAAMSSGR